MHRALLSLSLSSILLVACGADEHVPPAPVDARGPDYTFVVSDLDLPTSAAEAATLGLDLDDAGAVDNELGRVIEAVLAFQPPNDIESVLDTRIKWGELILLANLDARDLVNASGVGFLVFTGSNPSPSPCADPMDEVCGRHLSGNGAFQAVAADDNVVAGRIMNRRYLGSAAALTLQLGQIDGVPITLPLRDVRVRLDTTEPTSWGRGAIGGAIAAADLDAVLVPWLAAITGVSEANVRSAVQGVPLDLDLDGDNVDDALSVGIGIQGVPAWFTPVR